MTGWPFSRRKFLATGAGFAGWALTGSGLPRWAFAAADPDSISGATLGNIPSNMGRLTTGMKGLEAARMWAEKEFQPSTLSAAQQMAEMQFWVDKAKPFQGMEIHVVSETLRVRQYESQVLARAFSEITGINVVHDIIQKGDVVEKLQTEMQSGRTIYDMYINDSDFIGTHPRYNLVEALSDFMAKEGKDVTLPTLDVDDFMGKIFTTWTDGRLFQLPDQQFANLYWFRYDWFTSPDLMKQFKTATVTTSAYR